MDEHYFPEDLRMTTTPAAYIEQRQNANSSLKSLKEEMKTALKNHRVAGSPEPLNAPKEIET